MEEEGSLVQAQALDHGAARFPGQVVEVVGSQGGLDPTTTIIITTEQTSNRMEAGI